MLGQLPPETPSRCVINLKAALTRRTVALSAPLRPRWRPNTFTFRAQGDLEPKMAKITLVDDDENIVTSVSLALESHGHQVKACYDGASGLAALENDPPDLA